VAEANRGDFIARAPWPARDEAFKPEAEFDLVRDAINGIRQLRADYAIPPGQRITATLDIESAGDNGIRDTGIFSDEAAFIGRIARTDIKDSADFDEKGATILLSSGSRIHVALAGLVDMDKECRKAKGELDKLSEQLHALEKRLSNPGFTDRAPAHVVDAERQKQREWATRKAQLTEKVASLCGS
jgi:valyl-tRNA synthetase